MVNIANIVNDIEKACLGYLGQYLRVPFGVERRELQGGDTQVDLEIHIPGRPARTLLVDIKATTHLTQNLINHLICDSLGGFFEFV